MASDATRCADRPPGGRARAGRVRSLRRCLACGGSVVAAAALVFGSGSVAADPATARGDLSYLVGTIADRTVPNVAPIDDEAPAHPSGRTLRARPAVIAGERTGAARKGGDWRDASAAGAERADGEVAASIAAPTDTSANLQKGDRMGTPLEVRPLTRPVVVLYGDSLAWEARHAFKGAFADRPGVQVVERTFGGTAICDWFDEIAADATTLKPGLVVIEFIGNSFTPCMSDPAGQFLTGAAVVDRYAVDLESVIATFEAIGAQVVLAGSPASRAEADHAPPGGGALNALYQQVAAAHEGVRYADAGADVLNEGRWTRTLPCFAFEPCTGGVDAAGMGVNVIRSPDGVHFCPASAEAVRGVTGDCPVWSSGAFRYGSALARPAIESLDAS